MDGVVTRRLPSMTASNDVGLDVHEMPTLHERRRAAWAAFTDKLQDFQAALAAGRVHPTQKNGETRWLQWEAVEKSYRAFRATYVEHRVGRGPQRKHDRSLDRWTDQVARFRRLYYSSTTPAELKAVLDEYWSLRSSWHQKSPEYKDWKRSYMREYMRKRRAAAKLASSSEQGAANG